MIAAAECTDLVVAALDCAFADFRCVRAGDATVLLGQFKIFIPAVIVFDAPARSLFA